jgi:prephenate dehydratase
MNSMEHNPYKISTGIVNPEKKMSVIFSTKDGVGNLSSVLNIVKEFNLTMSRIESRPSSKKGWDFDFFLWISSTLWMVPLSVSPRNC